MPKYQAPTRVSELTVDVTNEQISKLYDDWADTYDKELIDDHKYSAPQTVVDIFNNRANKLNMPKDMKILDAGAGTGLVSIVLRKMGYSNIDGLDASQKMLDEAKKKNLYTNYIHAFMGPDPLPVKNDCYDAIVCVGTFTMGHVAGNGMPGLIEITKKGGLICFTIRNGVLYDKSYKFIETMEELVKEEKWKLLHQSEEDYLLKAKCHVYVYQKL